MLKFLIVQTAFIGDVVLATSLLEKLQIFYPTAQIDFMLRKGNETLFLDHPYLHKIWIWDKKKEKTKNLFRLISEIRKQKYDHVINLQRFFSSGLLTVLSGAKQKRGFKKNPFSSFFDLAIPHEISKNGDLHETERNQNLIADLTDSKAAMPKLYPSENDFAHIKTYQENKYICLAPSSVWFTKQYPEEYWILFLNQVPSDFTIYLLGAKSDFDKCEHILNSTNHSKCYNLSGKLSFLQSAALMKNAEMNFVNDSAPLHFASAMNANVTAIFCSTVPEFGFSPLSKNKNIIQTYVPLSCRPCGLHGYNSCPEKHFKCALTILPENLIAVLHD